MIQTMLRTPPRIRKRPTSPPCIYEERRRARARFFTRQCGPYVKSLFPDLVQEEDVDEHNLVCWREMLDQIKVRALARHERVIKDYSERLRSSSGDSLNETCQYFWKEVVRTNDAYEITRNSPYVMDKLGLMMKMRNVKERDTLQQLLLASIFYLRCTKIQPHQKDNQVSLNNRIKEYYRRLFPRSRALICMKAGVSFLKHAPQKRKRGESCAICLEPLEDPAKICEMPCSGKHQFHVGCVRTSMISHADLRCPCCRHFIL